MPSSHRRYAEWSTARLLREAEKIGPATLALFAAIMKAKPHPEQGFRSCLGILSLVKSYGAERIEAAASAATIYTSTHLRLDQVDPAQRARSRHVKPPPVPLIAPA
jgi:transposase